MEKKDLLKNIAEKGYDVGFGAKKHFATYDLIEKTPGMIGFISMSFGVLALAVKGLSTDISSALLIIFGIVGLYINFYNHNKEAYSNAGTELTKLFNELKTLYFHVKSLDDNDNLLQHQETLSKIEERFYPICLNKQILFSNWYAHYKFYWEHQISWIDQELNFKFFRDRVPLSLSLTVIVLASSAIILASNFMTQICVLTK
jgi:SMODS and SLOG-associating 2TM effector domain 6